MNIHPKKSSNGSKFYSNLTISSFENELIYCQVFLEKKCIAFEQNIAKKTHWSLSTLGVLTLFPKPSLSSTSRGPLPDSWVLGFA
jgi:hypothetical protein